MADRISSLTSATARLLAGWRRNASGGIATSFALALPVLLAIVGVATDYAMLSKIKHELQEVADAAAMAGAREIPLAVSKATQVESAVRAFAAYRLTKDSAATAADLASRNISVDVKVNPDFSGVQVSISEQWSPFFMHFIDQKVTPISVDSHARFVGRNNICVLGLAHSGVAVNLDAGSRLTGNDCGVFSNSSGGNGLKIDTGSIVKASIVCSSGGASISGGASVTPEAITDCPAVDDPLAERSMPAVGGCDHRNKVLTSVTRTISPGVYCGGLTIDGTSNVTLESGVYVIKDGALKVAGNARITGNGVGFFITGAATPTIFSANSHISLVAPASGPMAGLLFFEDRDLPVALNHRITSDDARVLLGTIYLPVGSLVIDAKKPVADQSAYTAIVAQSVQLRMGPNLVLNSDYEATNVPVPEGIAGSSQVILQN
jgi:hypothetical protein